MQPGKTTYDQYLSALPDVKRYLESIDNLLAIGIGLKETNENIEHRLVYRIYVKEKKDVAALREGQCIPSSIFSFQTDIIEPHRLDDLGQFADPNLTNEAIEQAYKINSSINTNSFGTLGCFGRLQNGALVFLTNKHVVYDNLKATDTRNFPVYLKLDNVIDELIDIGHTIIGIRNEKVDCALVISKRFRENSNENAEETLCCAEVFPGDSVGKTGGGSIQTKGVILHKGDIATINEAGHLNIYRSKLIIYPQIKNTSFSNEMKNIFSSPGDSGAALLDHKKRVVGLIHGGLKHHHVSLTVASEINEVNKAFADYGYPVSTNCWNANFSRINEHNIFSVNPELDEISWLISKHQKEVISLIKQSRLVAAVWTKYQGHAFAAGFKGYFEGLKTFVAGKHNSVDFRQMTCKMFEVLIVAGSSSLKKDIHLYGDCVTTRLEKITNKN